jgi:hypothetical protein
MMKRIAMAGEQFVKVVVSSNLGVQVSEAHRDSRISTTRIATVLDQQRHSAWARMKDLY